jgi:DNA-binding transcriptional MerR regulator/mannose-6-phosphate isomerase-like protein (cupin superfamily)
MPSTRSRIIKGKTGDKSYLRIGDVARLVGISRSVLRDWENLGLLRPARTRSGYRLYTTDDVELLRRARQMRKQQGLNAAAIVHLLTSESRPDGSQSPPDRGTSPGRRLRNLRMRRGLSLVTVARATGVSVGFLSALERARTTASVATLRKLARFYNLNVLDFFNTSASNPHWVRPEERKVLEVGPGVRLELLAWGHTVMEPHLFRIRAGASSGESYRHEGEEFLYILRGQFEISLGGAKPYRLGPGDAFYFESTTPHHWRNPGREETWVIWINTPPTF